MAEGKVVLFMNDDRENNRPHFKGFIEIDGVEHEFAVWPSRSGNGYSGKYKPKAAKEAAKAEDKPVYSSDPDIPF